MTRSILFAAALIASASACATGHLGDDTNVAYHEAFAAQRESDPERKPTFGADDARSTNAARRGEKSKPGAATSPAAGSSSLPAPAMNNAGAWPGAKGNMSLEAK